MNQATDPVWMTLKEAAVYARLNPEVLRRKCMRREVQHGRSGLEYKFKREHIDNYFMANGWDGRRKA